MVRANRNASSKKYSIAGLFYDYQIQAYGSVLWVEKYLARCFIWIIINKMSYFKINQ